MPSIPSVLGVDCKETISPQLHKYQVASSHCITYFTDYSFLWMHISRQCTCACVAFFFKTIPQSTAVSLGIYPMNKGSINSEGYRERVWNFCVTSVIPIYIFTTKIIQKSVLLAYYCSSRRTKQFYLPNTECVHYIVHTCLPA